jgi:hypothetical protein
MGATRIGLEARPWAVGINNLEGLRNPGVEPHAKSPSESIHDLHKANLDSAEHI